MVLHKIPSSNHSFVSSFNVNKRNIDCSSETSRKKRVLEDFFSSTRINFLRNAIFQGKPITENINERISRHRRHDENFSSDEQELFDLTGFLKKS